MKKIYSMSLDDLHHGITRFKREDRPWLYQPAAIDWHIALETGELLPLKYICALAINQSPGKHFTTNEAKSQLRKLGFAYISLSSESNRFLKFEAQVQAARKNAKGRADRLATASRTPSKRLIAQWSYQRNPDVVAEVLERAKGQCEVCKKPAPFHRLSDGSPYLEVHHIQKMAAGGDDSVENAIAICPNCHRREHFGISVL